MNNSDDVFERLRQQDEAIRRMQITKQIFYAHYDPTTRKLLSFRNYLEETDPNPHVEVTEDHLDVPLSEFSVENQVVLIKDKKPRIESFQPSILGITKISDFIYEIPKMISEKRITYKDKTFDLMIEQNNEEEVFKIKLAKDIRQKYSLQSFSHQLMYVYVTAVNDPNILYKTLKFTFGDLVKHEYHTIKFEDFKGDEANIYAFKYFDEYLHVDIR